MGDETAGYLASHADAVRTHLASLMAAAPGLPAELARLREQLAGEWQTRGAGTVLGLILAFVVLGLAVEALYRYSVRAAAVEDRTVRERLRSTSLRVARDLGAVVAFTLGSAAAFLAFEWPERIRHAVIGFLAAVIALRLTIVVARVLLSPREPRLRILPASDDEARHRFQRFALFAGWLAFGWALVNWLAGLGMNLPSRQIVAYLLGLGLLAIAVEAVWRRSRAAAAGFVLLWLLWIARAWGFFWLVAMAMALPAVLRGLQAGVDQVLRDPGAAPEAPHGVLAAVLGRGLRAVAIIGAAYLLLRAAGLDVDTVASSDALWMQLLRGAVNALAIILLADLAWKVCAALIDRKLAESQPAGTTPSDEEHRRARFRTLLPIVRSTILGTLIVMAILMALSALGVKVMPLLAGAGVVGVAIGFGSQTLVRDLLSKFFYLLDDAFRVGEYIQSGTYKGTVEHLGVRSVRLRHHRGPLYTIPYGQLGAVQNMSRDWVIDKMTIGVVYGTDLDKVKKLIKQIGTELAANPEFAPQILEPLKMQGVEQFGDFAIQVRMKMKTLPNQQFTIRRRAYAMIKQRFADNGIEFAFPTVQIAGGAQDSAAIAAAARQVLDQGKSAA